MYTRSMPLNAHMLGVWNSGTVAYLSAMALSAFFVVSLIERRATRWARGVQLPE